MSNETAARSAFASNTRPCGICGEHEPHHVHNDGERIEDYFTVGRGQSDFQAALSWQRKYAALAHERSVGAAPITGLRNEWHQGHVDAAMANPECEDCAFLDPGERSARAAPPIDLVARYLRDHSREGRR